MDSQREARFHYSASFPEVLRQMRCSLLVSTYQVGQLVAIGLDAEGKVSFSFHGFDQAMGVAASPSRLAVGTKGQVWFLTDNSALAPDIAPAGTVRPLLPAPLRDCDGRDPLP